MAGRIEKLKAYSVKKLRSDLPDFDVGDTVKMKIKVQEADKIRLHAWEGVVISKKGKGIAEVFTTRKISFGEGVEKTFPLHSPFIDSLKVVAKAKINRAKLYFLRDRQGKKARIKSEVVAS